jgi:hypothetical protein
VSLAAVAVRGVGLAADGAGGFGLEGPLADSFGEHALTMAAAPTPPAARNS